MKLDLARCSFGSLDSDVVELRVSAFIMDWIHWHALIAYFLYLLGSAVIDHKVTNFASQGFFLLRWRHWLWFLSIGINTSAEAGRSCLIDSALLPREPSEGLTAGPLNPALIIYAHLRQEFLHSTAIPHPNFLASTRSHLNEVGGASPFL